MGVVERLHLGGAVVAPVARRDACRVAAQRIDDLGDCGPIAIGNIAAIGLVGIRGCQQRERDQAARETMRSAFHSGPDRPKETARSGESLEGIRLP
jgi:hypothetical protein